MSDIFDKPRIPAVLNHGWLEIEGERKPGLEQSVDKEIYKVMIEQRREINRRNLPDLD